MRELAALFMSNWGLDFNAKKISGGSQSEAAFDNKGGMYYDDDGNIVEGFFDDGMDLFNDGHWPEAGGRRDWGEEAVFWLNRAVRTETFSPHLRC